MDCNNLRNKNFAICDNHTTFVAKENKREYRLENSLRKKICKIRLDNGYITEENVAKCDFGFLVCDDMYMILVELKGSDFIHAVEQISSTIQLMNRELENQSVSARIVLSKMQLPNIENNPKFLKLKKMIKLKKGNIKYKSRILSENIY
ncbi:hypothetical protein [Tenuifilum thalassicum]|uniref:Uncharacterized protein n=1 Tax=Tenuifilum thalassicum TaxID=2590900 RepID=A0A7D4CSE4_9BACT|nr:hypothetical protein [Tenuifilum thalassicum]QKG80805.1 hypothetical protein FHG85_11195 [Tenuifilum thalassicum]